VDFDFDAPIERRETASFKWDMYAGDVLPLWVADMDFASPPQVSEALEARARHNVFGYSLVPDSLVEAIVAHLERRYGWRIEPDWIVWLPSVVPGLNLAGRAFAGAGEAVLSITPVYPPFLEAPGQHGRRLVTVPAEMSDGAWQLPLDAMEAAVTPDSRVLLFCHPHNPLGRVWRRDEVEAVAHFCRRHDLVLVSDEIHCDLILDELAHVPAALASPDDADRIITLMSPSKTFNLPGLNFAFAIVSDGELRERFRAPGAGLLPFPGCFAVAAAEAAYRGGAEWHAGLLDYLRGNRDLVESFVARELPRVTMTHVEATYLAWLDVRALGLDDPAAACRAAGVALSAGAAFGDPAYLRLNFGCRRETLLEALSRLRTVLR
jgi:cysteine-S-conjugate beta-lyase